MGADRKLKRTLRGGGALQFLDLRLFEDGSECGGALVYDVVAQETARVAVVGVVIVKARQSAV